MNKYILIFFSILFLFSCTEDKEKSVIKESWEIIDWYADTLEWTIWDAREVKNILDWNNNTLWEELQNIK